MVLMKMVEDLYFGVEIVVVLMLCELEGLVMSLCNCYLGMN